ncbi:hypothetical protein G3M48_000377 [Beauveria asiatica]|uniref:Uncharacterized protein n=1 Tax=Beauveria asiatica TaxID=1069075 RepID=A0AAW0S0P4_9HYPO
MSTLYNQPTLSTTHAPHDRPPSNGQYPPSITSLQHPMLIGIVVGMTDLQRGVHVRRPVGAVAAMPACGLQKQPRGTLLLYLDASLARLQTLGIIGVAAKSARGALQTEEGGCIEG